MVWFGFVTVKNGNTFSVIKLIPSVSDFNHDRLPFIKSSMPEDKGWKICFTIVKQKVSNECPATQAQKEASRIFFKSSKNLMRLYISISKGCVGLQRLEPIRTVMAIKFLQNSPENLSYLRSSKTSRDI